MRLFERGLIYRGERMVNWCPFLATAVSDIEVDYVEAKGPTKVTVPGRERPVQLGQIHRFAYKVLRARAAHRTRRADRLQVDGAKEGEEVVVATTRIETMFGDTAVAVHPDDARYKHLHGRMLVQPLTGRRVPLVTDAILVDPAVGTGGRERTRRAPRKAALFTLRRRCREGHAGA